MVFRILGGVEVPKNFKLWGQRIFGFLRTEAGKTLTSVIGFPAVTSSSIKVPDELFNRLDKSDVKPLFQIRPMMLALSEQAKMEYTGGIPRKKVGCLNPGFAVFARRGDYHAIVNATDCCYPHLGFLIPQNVEPSYIASGTYVNPLANVTHVVSNTNMLPTKLELKFNFNINNSRWLLPYNKSNLKFPYLK